MSVQNQTTSIFTRMTQLAMNHGAINLSQGFPNFPIDPVLSDILADAARRNVHQYLPYSGYPPLLEKIAGLVERSYGRSLDPSAEILVTAGATQGIFTAIQALISPGDEVVILDPAYDCYDMPVHLRGGKSVHVPLADDMLPDWNAVGAAVNKNTRIIIINNPHNPSGRVWRESDFEALEKIMESFPQLKILSDEVYEFITFGPKHVSINQRPKLRGRSLIISSFGKSFHITGWKIGYLIAPEDLMARIKNVHQFLVFCVNSPAQVAICEYLDHADVSGLSDFYREKRDRFQGLMEATKFTLLPCEGTYFQCASYEKISDETDIDLCERLVLDAGVSIIPLSPFYQDNSAPKIVRFCFAKDDATLEAAALRLLKL